MKKHNKTNRERIRAAQKRKSVNKLVVKLLELLIKCYGTASVSESEEILQRLREVNNSVGIIARHLKRETHAKTS